MKSKPVKLQTRMTASNVVLVGVFIFNVDVEYIKKSNCAVVVVGFNSMLALVSSSVIECVIDDSVGSILDFNRTKIVELDNENVVGIVSVIGVIVVDMRIDAVVVVVAIVIGAVLITAKKIFH